MGPVAGAGSPADSPIPVMPGASQYPWQVCCDTHLLRCRLGGETHGVRGRTKEKQDLKNGGASSARCGPGKPGLGLCPPRSDGQGSKDPRFAQEPRNARSTSTQPQHGLREGKQRLASTGCLPSVGCQLGSLHGTPQAVLLLPPGLGVNDSLRSPQQPGCQGPPRVFHLGLPDLSKRGGSGNATGSAHKPHPK